MSTQKSKRQDGMSFPDPSVEIIKLYRQHVPVYLAEFRNAIEKGDQASVMFHSHKMCSAMKTMGFDNIADLLEKIQIEKPGAEELDSIGQKVEKLVQHTLVLLEKS